MTEKLIDQLLKKMAEYHADEFIRLAFPDTEFRVISSTQDKEIIFKTREVDTVIKINSDDKDFLVHLEFQTEYDPEIARRMFIYAGVLTAKYNLDVISVLFQIKPPPKKVKTLDQYDIIFGNLLVNSFRFSCIRLWEYRDDILAGKKQFMNFVPLLLELFPKPDESLLRKQRELIQRETDLKRRAELTTFCLALASKYFDFNLVTKFFKEDQAMIETFEELPIIGEKIKEKLQAAETRGLQDGIRGIIIDLVEDRFQSKDGIEDLLDHIEDVNLLKKIFRIALKTNSMDSFKITLTELSK